MKLLSSMVHMWCIEHHDFLNMVVLIPQYYCNKMTLNPTAKKYQAEPLKHSSPFSVKVKVHSSPLCYILVIA